ncbi:MAG: hypothetical protein ACI9H6_000844 [Patiriisocius sp.]|jgi:hypothetical protein
MSWSEDLLQLVEQLQRVFKPTLLCILYFKSIPLSPTTYTLYTTSYHRPPQLYTVSPNKTNNMGLLKLVNKGYI